MNRAATIVLVYFLFFSCMNLFTSSPSLIPTLVVSAEPNSTPELHRINEYVKIGGGGRVGGGGGSRGGGGASSGSRGSPARGGGTTKSPGKKDDSTSKGKGTSPGTRGGGTGTGSGAGIGGAAGGAFIIGGAGRRGATNSTRGAKNNSNKNELAVVTATTLTALIISLSFFIV